MPKSRLRFYYPLFFLVLLLVPTGCSDSGGWTQEQRLNAQNVELALNARNEAARLSNNIGTAVVNREQFYPIVAKLRAALEYANAVKRRCP